MLLEEHTEDVSCAESQEGEDGGASSPTCSPRAPAVWDYQYNNCSNSLLFSNRGGGFGRSTDHPRRLTCRALLGHPAAAAVLRARRSRQETLGPVLKVVLSLHPPPPI